MTPVLPPMLESTIASSVVGTRDQANAALPDGGRKARQVADRAAAHRDHAAASIDALPLEKREHLLAAGVIDLERSPTGITWIAVFSPARLIVLATFTAHGLTFESVMIATPVGSSRVTTLRSSRWMLLPITTG